MEVFTFLGRYFQVNTTTRRLAGFLPGCRHFDVVTLPDQSIQFGELEDILKISIDTIVVFDTNGPLISQRLLTGLPIAIRLNGGSNPAPLVPDYGLSAVIGDFFVKTGSRLPAFRTCGSLNWRR